MKQTFNIISTIVHKTPASTRNIMMKIFVMLLGIFAIFSMVACRPSDLAPGAITRDIKVELPGSERINRRSADYLETSAAIPVDISSDDDSEETYSDDSSTDYYPPEGGHAILEREALEEIDDDMEKAESNIIFHPLFASRKRSVEKKRKSRSAESPKDVKEDELETAENGMVFLPLFRSRNRLDEKQRLRRAAEEDNADEMVTAENGMVFMPLFRSKSRLEEKRRVRRSEEAKPKISLDVIGTPDDLEVAKDLIFTPVFKRTIRPARSIQEESIRGGQSDVLFGDDDLAAAENGLIFRPLFRTKQRDV